MKLRSLFPLGGLVLLLGLRGYAQAQSFANIAGTYSASQTVTLRVTQGGQSDTQTLSGSDTVTITQTGNTFTYTLRDPNSGQSYVRSGTVSGNTLTFTGGGPVVGFQNVSGLVVNTNQLLSGTGTVRQGRIDITMTGRATGSLSGSAFVVDVTATGVFLGNVTPVGPPQIVTQPQGRSVNAGTSVTLSVSASGTGSLTYQWRKDGTNISGATSATYTIGNAQPGDAGSYTVVVTNSDGSVTSTAATLTVIATQAPTITAQPQGQTVNAGANVTLAVSASSTVPLTYQWYKDGVAIPGATGGTLQRSNVTSADAGSYTVVVTNSAGSTTSAGAVLAVNAAPAIAGQPRSVTIGAGATVAFAVSVSGSTPLTYQWRKNGTNITGATRATLLLNAVSAADAASYSVAVTNNFGSVTSAAAALALSANVDPGRLSNLSILTDVTAADPVFTVGTVLGGAGTSGSKPLLVRAGGPSLASLGVAGALADPKLDLFSGQTVIAANDNWGGTPALLDAFARVAAFSFSSANSRDAAIYNAAIPAGAYTVQVSGVGGAAGVVIAELYDATPAASFTPTTPRLVNLSVLKNIPARNILTAGFVIGGSTARTLLVRAIGPRLAQAPFSISGALADPKLDVFSGQTVIASNDDWGGDAQLTAVGDSVGAFAVTSATSRDAMLLVALAPGAYTVQVTGVGGTAGLALVEVYEVP